MQMKQRRLIMEAEIFSETLELRRHSQKAYRPEILHCAIRLTLHYKGLVTLNTFYYGTSACCERVSQLSYAFPFLQFKPLLKNQSVTNKSADRLTKWSKNQVGK
jgi:hypothetical protein